MIGKQYEYEAMANCEATLWWYKNLHALTAQEIATHFQNTEISILDAGCGTGGTLAYLQACGYQQLTGFDISPDAIHFASERGIVPIFQQDMLHISDHHQSYDVVIILDSISMLTMELAKQAFHNLYQLVKPGGIMIINLPALRAFRGTHDIAVGIEQRYNRMLAQELAGDVPVTYMRYWPFFASPLIFGQRFWQRLKMAVNRKSDYPSDVSLPPGFINRLLTALCTVERKIDIAPWGSSLMITVKKPA